MWTLPVSSTLPIKETLGFNLYSTPTFLYADPKETIFDNLVKILI